MEIKQLQEKIDEHVKKHGGYWKPHEILARLTEEVGELAHAINIKYGPKKKKNDSDGDEISEEIADTLLTINAMANSLGIDLEKEIKRFPKPSLFPQQADGVFRSVSRRKSLILHLSQQAAGY